MRLLINPEDTSFFAQSHQDIYRFLRHLEQVYVVNDSPNPFDECWVRRAWGLIVFIFNAPTGRVTLPMNVALLDVFEDTVVKDDGTIVDRYEKLAEELVKTATDRLSGLPILVKNRG